MIINHFKHSQIDIDKYDECITNSIQSRIYAHSWYLDIVADNWNVLVLNDYEAVMPLPYMRAKRNLFLAKIIQPPFCQQLGVFSKINLSDEVFNTFLDNFLKHKPKLYNFNSLNSDINKFKKISYEKKINYELDLSGRYEDIRKIYSTNLKRNISKAEKKSLQISNDISVEKLILLKKRNKKYKISDKNFRKIENLIKELRTRNLGYTYGVYFEKELIVAAFFIIYKKRFIYLFSSNSNQSKKHGAMPFLLDTLIKQNVGKHNIFDFEGSMILGVSKFFKSFGAKLINYYCFVK